MDPTVRKENVLREERIKFFSEVLAVAHKHKDFLDRAGKYDTVTSTVDTIRKSLASSKDIRRSTWAQSYKSRERNLIEIGMVEAFGLILKSPDIRLSTGKELHISKRIGSSVFSVTVGWMWHRKVYQPLYHGCTKFYGKHVILAATRMRVNQKWIELYSVKAYSHDKKSIIDGYVAKTKTDRKNCVFNIEAAKAVSKAIEWMHSEMDAQLKGSRND